MSDHNTETTELAVTDKLPGLTRSMTQQANLGALIPRNIEEAVTYAKTLYMSKLFPDLQSAEQAVVKIMAGAELGIPPIASQNAFHIVKGKIMMHYSAIAGAVKRVGCKYKVDQHDDETCTLTFYDSEGAKLGQSEFTQSDAKKAGTQNMEKIPKVMLFARAMSQGARMLVPEAFNGMVVYESSERDLIESEEDSPIVSTALKAMEVASARVNKDKPAEEPASVIEAAFTQTPDDDPVVPPASAPEDVAPATPTIEEEAPTFSNGGKPDPFDKSESAEKEWVEEGTNVALNKFVKEGTDEVWFEIVVKVTGSAIPNFAGKNALAMSDALAKVDKAFALSDAQLNKQAKGDGVEAKIATGILSIRPKSTTTAELPTVKDMKKTEDSDHVARTQRLIDEIGEESFAGIAAFSARKGDTVLRDFLETKMGDVRTDEYLELSADNKSQKVSAALMSWVKTLVKPEGS